VLTYTSTLRALLATDPPSHDASKPICRFWSCLLAPSDPPHAEPSLSAVLAHAHECAPRAPRHRDAIAQRLETDLPLLVMPASAFRSAACWRLAVCGACSRTQVRSARSSPPTHHRRRLETDLPLLSLA